MLLLMLLTTMTAWSQDLTISSTEDWNTFANNVNNGTSYSGKTVKLNADISVTTMVGTYDYPFNGTFDGGGHTLNVTLNNDSQYGDEDAYYGVAPFRFTNGATFQFLVVTGIVTTSTRKYAAGLIGMTKGGTNTILNCISSVEIYSTINNKWGDNDGTHGGFIGKASGTVIINNCLFNGQLTTTSDNPTINCGGFVGWKNGTLSISNSLYAPNTTIPSGKTAVNVGATFSRNDVTPTNSYYTQTLGTAQGTAVGSKTATQLVAALGSAWRVSGGRAVPKLLLSTKSFTIANAAGADYCGTITYGGNDFLVPDADMMQNQLFEGKITMRSKMTGNEGTVKLYPRMSGKVKSLTFSSARVTFSDVVGTEHYVKIGRGDIWTNSYTEDMNKATALTFTFTNDEGLQLANEDDYLEIKMRNSESTRNASLQNIEGKITITYEPTEATETHRHNFTYIVEGNTLTATCAHDDGKECNLASSSYQISTSLIPPTNLTFNDGWFYSASMSGFESFRSETKATIGSITYIKTDTNEDYGTSEPNAIGTYSASVTINADNYPYTLTTSYRVTDFNFIHINYPQFTTDKAENNYVGDGETVTLTFTPKFGETLTGLTVTGATTNYSIGSGITSIGNNKYTFTMPAEDVTISATFTAPDASNFEQNGDAYTIKTANGWGWFCFATNYDLASDGFSGKTVKLAANVSSSEMAGKSGHPFKGTFDGQGNTLTFNRTAAEHLSAPFHYINGATISNLHVEGTITGGNYESLGGLVGHAEGHITINNCRVSTEISTTVSGSASHGGVIAQWNGTNATCTVTGCVYDGLIYNPNEAGVTTSCRGFIGWDYGNNGTITFTDCLFTPAAYGTGKYALGGNCFTFVYPNSEPTYNMTNCYYTSILGNRQGRPAATATVAPDNLGNATTDHGMVDGYENGFLYNGNYYTPKYGDAVVEYRYDDWNERADVTLSDRTLYKDGNWNTLCLPFSLSAAQIAANANFAGATLMTMDVTEKNGFDVEDGTLYLWFKTATEIEAGVPYLVKWDKAADYDNNPSVNDIVSPVFEGVTISNSTAQTVESKTAGLETVQMVGTYSPVGVTADDKSILFLGDANTLYYSTVDRQIRSYRAYFSVPYINGHAEAKARAFALSFDGEETTGILGVSANYNGVTDEAWYSLDGVRLSGKPTQRGLYINNGKKVVIK